MLTLCLRSARAVPWSLFSTSGFLGRPPRGLDIVYYAQDRVSSLNTMVFCILTPPLVPCLAESRRLSRPLCSVQRYMTLFSSPDQYRSNE